MTKNNLLKSIGEEFSTKDLEEVIDKDILEQMNFVVSEEEIDDVLKKQSQYDGGL